MRFLLLFTILTTMLGLLTLAYSEEGPDKTDLARAHLRAGIAYYDDGKYDDAVKEMQVAYSLRPVPDLQYNLAQCFERLGRYEDAAVAYETYLGGRRDASDGAQVRVRIGHLRERAAAAAAGQAAAPVAVEKVVFKTIVVYRKEPPAPGRAARFAAGGLWALAAVAAASGIAFSVLAKQSADAVTSGGNVDGPVNFGDVRATQESGKTSVIVAGVSFGIAGLAALGGAGLWVIGRKIDREAPKLSVLPSLGPNYAGLAAAGRF